MSTLRIGLIGAGNMAQALTRGIIESGVARPQDILAASPQADQPLLEVMKKMGCKTTHCNAEAASSGDVTILAVKPNVMDAVLKDIRERVFENGPLIASIAMGVSLKTMQEALPPNSRVIRCMPNTPVLVRAGCSVYCRGSHTSDRDVEHIIRLLSSVGSCHEVPELYLDAVTGLSAAGPAYAYVIIEALADGGVQMGLPRDLALNLAAQTLQGGAKMILDTHKHPGVLKDNVCSPGGCTIAGVAALEYGGVRGALMKAVEAATLRARRVEE